MLYHLKRGYSAIFNAQGNLLNRVVVPFTMALTGAHLVSTGAPEPSSDITPDTGTYQAEMLATTLGDLQQSRRILDQKALEISKLQWRSNLSTDPSLTLDINKRKQELTELTRQQTLKGFAFERALLLADGISETQSIQFAESYRTVNTNGFKNYLETNVTHLPKLLVNLDECQIKNKAAGTQGATNVVQCMQNMPYDGTGLTMLFTGAATGNLLALLLGGIGTTWRRQTEDEAKRRKEGIIRQNIRIKTKP